MYKRTMEFQPVLFQGQLYTSPVMKHHHQHRSSRTQDRAQLLVDFHLV